MTKKVLQPQWVQALFNKLGFQTQAAKDEPKKEEAEEKKAPSRDRKVTPKKLGKKAEEDEKTEEK